MHSGQNIIMQTWDSYISITGVTCITNILSLLREEPYMTWTVPYLLFSTGCYQLKCRWWIQSKYVNMPGPLRPNPPPGARNFEEFLSTQPYLYDNRHILGQIGLPLDDVKYPAKNIVDSNKGKTSVHAVSDGSVINRCVSHAWKVVAK